MPYSYFWDAFRAGEPIFPVEERLVLQSDIPGESSWATQPFVTKPAPLMPHGPFSPDDAWGPTEATRNECKSILEKHISKGIFTPPTEQGTLMYPGNGLGINWGSTAFDPERGRWVLNTSTPMMFEADGKQFVVIAAGGHGKAGLELGDYLIAFSLGD